MRAARYYGLGDIRIEEVPEPKVTDGKVLLEVAWCGICGSDLHEFVQGPLFPMQGEHPLTGEAPPVAMGHEFCGIVRNPPEGSQFADGDAVTVDPRVICRSCTNCKSGATYACELMGGHGYNTNGGFAERVAVDERMLHKLPPHVSVDYAAVVEPLAVVQHGVKMTGLSDWSNKSVLVLGGGPIGFALTIVLRAHGVKTIVVSEPTLKRRENISSFVTASMDPIKENIDAKCKEITDGRGVDIVFDCAGVPAAIETGFGALRLCGQYMNLAVWEQPIVLPQGLFLGKHITIKSALAYDEEDYLMLADKKLDGYEQLVTSRIKLEDVVEKGFKELVNNKDKHIKILVTARL